MAMSWSHSPEALWYAMSKVHRLSRKKLTTIWAEIKSAEKDEYGCYPSSTSNFDAERYAQELARAKELPNDTLASDIWDFMEQELRTCSNDFKEAWCCPYGCHVVPFGPERKRK